MDVSWDGKHIYVTGFKDPYIAWVTRDVNTGVLSQMNSLSINSVGGSTGNSEVIVSPDDKHVYVSLASNNANVEVCF